MVILLAHRFIIYLLATGNTASTQIYYLFTGYYITLNNLVNQFSIIKVLLSSQLEFQSDENLHPVLLFMLKTVKCKTILASCRSFLLHGNNQDLNHTWKMVVQL